MYNQWLYFFNSPSYEISVKNTAKKSQKVQKEWLDDGSMKMSGEQPTKWSLTLQPILSTDIQTLNYELENNIEEAKYLFKRAFKDRDKNLFNDGEELYSDSVKKQKDIETIQTENDDLLKNIKEKIFQIRRNIYLESNKDNPDKKKIKRLTNELEMALIEQNDIIELINEKENNYILRSQSIVRQGPVPPPPTVKALSLKIGREKMNFEKRLENLEDISDEITNNSKGGYIKVIKLGH